MKVAIHWFRRDLRLTDNTALNAAAKSAETVVPVYILSDWQNITTGPDRIARNFSVRAWRRCRKTSPPSVRGSSSVAARRNVNSPVSPPKPGPGPSFATATRTPSVAAVEDRLAALAKRQGIAFSTHPDVALHERGELVSGAGLPYRAYAPYFKTWSKSPKPTVGPRPKRLTIPPGIDSLPLPDLSHWKLRSEGARLIEAGEHAARQRLSDFLGPRGGARRYAIGRTELTGRTTSRFLAGFALGFAVGA